MNYPPRATPRTRRARSGCQPTANDHLLNSLVVAVLVICVLAVVIASAL